MSQAKILEWAAISCSRESSRPRDWTHVSYVSDSLPLSPPGKPVSLDCKCPIFCHSPATIFLCPCLIWTCSHLPMSFFKSDPQNQPNVIWSEKKTPCHFFCLPSLPRRVHPNTETMPLQWLQLNLGSPQVVATWTQILIGGWKGGHVLSGVQTHCLLERHHHLGETQPADGKGSETIPALSFPLAVSSDWPLGLPGGTGGKEPTCQCWRHKRCWFDPWIGEIPWRRKWHPTPVFLLGESHGQRSLAGYSLWGPQGVRHDWASENLIDRRNSAPWRQPTPNLQNNVFTCLQPRLYQGTSPQRVSPIHTSKFTVWAHLKPRHPKIPLWKHFMVLNKRIRVKGAVIHKNVSQGKAQWNGKSEDSSFRSAVSCFTAIRWQTPT